MLHIVGLGAFGAQESTIQDNDAFVTTQNDISQSLKTNPTALSLNAVQDILKNYT